MVALKLLLAIATIGLALPAQAAPAPIVFDFEDGLQGWELTAQRVQTQILGGEWAIFGDGLIGAVMSIDVDLTDIRSISVERFYIAGAEDGLAAVSRATLLSHVSEQCGVSVRSLRELTKDRRVLGQKLGEILVEKGLITPLFWRVLCVRLLERPHRRTWPRLFGKD